MVDLKVGYIAVTIHEVSYLICGDDNDKYTITLSLDRNKNKAMITTSKNVGEGDLLKVKRFTWLDVAELFMTEPCVKSLCSYSGFYDSGVDLPILQVSPKPVEVEWYLGKKTATSNWERWTYDTTNIATNGDESVILFENLGVISNTKIKMAYTEFMSLLARTNEYIQKTKYHVTVK